MKEKLIFFLLFLSIALMALVKTYGIVHQFHADFLFPLKNGQNTKLDTLEAKLARLQANQNGTIIIPIRQGFPYCEPFTGNILERVNTKVGGSATLTAAAGQNNGVLQLTNINTPEQLGYAYIDLPFSSTYGINVAFEYFIYNGTVDPISGLPNDPGDGISFFLYDGAISAADFRIGGLGGSLGYSPHGYHNPLGVPGFTGDPGDISILNSEGEQGFGGLKGGYLGIGFDVWGNFGNEFQRRLGGFSRPNDYWATTPAAVAPDPKPRYPNSVVVRGPQIIQADEYRRNGMLKIYPETGKFVPKYTSYQFITGKITYKDPSIIPGSDIDAGTGSLGPGDFVSQMFKLGSTKRVEDCSVDGYRKVFIDFKPINPTNPSTGYQIKVDMLVNNGTANPQLVNILNTTFTPSQQVPASFKLGFAGATGAKQAFQEIRNVTVQVSNENQLTKPETNPLNGVACIGSQDLFELDVTLNNINSEIQCIQLYKNEAEALAVSKEIDNITSVQDCDSGICEIEVCSQQRLTQSTSLGDFEAILFLENGVEIPRVKFTSNQGALGSETIWYTVTDNFGQISVPKPITVKINPFPKIDSSGTIIGPTCNGQNDGEISNVMLKDLIPGYTFAWSDSSGTILPSSSYSVSESAVGGYIQATVGVAGVNLGKYFLTVNNPATNSACGDTFGFEVKDVRGTPVAVVLDDQQICEGTPVVFSPQLEDPDDAPNPTFLWWKDNNKNQPITHNLTEGSIKYQIVSPGILTITGLPQSPTPFEYFVEVAADASQNLCATPAGKLKRVQVMVLPPLSLDAVVADDLCLDGVGAITVNATGGFGTYTYSLDGGAAQASNTFSGLFPGTYSIEVTAGTNCMGTITREVLGAPELFLVEDEFIHPACNVPNGQLKVSFSGGTAGYRLEFFKNAALIASSNSPSSTTVYSDLAPGNYQVKITDAHGCIRTIDRQLTNEAGISITVDPMQTEICEGEVASIIPVVNTSGNASLKWYKDAAMTQEIVSSPTPDGNGHVYTINSSSSELQVGGLKAGTYSYYLAPNGAGYCPNPPNRADIVVLAPITAAIRPTDETCYNASDGTITVNAAGADGNFEYSLNGGSFVSAHFFSGLAPGIYTIDIRSTGSNGCTFKASTEIKGPASPISINAPDIIPIRSSCDLNNGSIENLVISGGWGSYSVEWRKGSIVGPLVPGNLNGANDLFPDTYYLIISDGKGCQVDFSFLVEEMPDPKFVVPGVGICAGEEAVLTPVNTVSGSADSEIKWYKDNGLSQLIENGSDSGNPTITYSQNANGQLTIQGLPGSETPYVYFMEVVCTGAVVQVETMVRIVPDLKFETTPETCFGAADGKIEVISGGIGTFEYSIDGAAPIPEAALEALTFAPKVYSISVTNSSLCAQVFQVEVKAPQAKITRASFNELRSSCNLDNGSIENVVISGGWGGYTAEWRKGLPNGSIIPGDITGAENLGPDIYYLIVTDREGCQETFEFNITEQPQPFFAVNAVEICAGESVAFIPVNTVSGSSSTELNWFKDAGKTKPIQNGPDSSDPTVVYSINPSNGNLTITGLKGSVTPYSHYLNVTCSDQLVKADVLVRVVPDPELVSEPVSCFGGDDGKILVQNGGDAKYLYSIDGGKPMTEAELEGLSFSAKTYLVQVSNEGFCEVIFSVEVKQPLAQLKVDPLTKMDPGCGANVGTIGAQITGGWKDYQVETFKDGKSHSKSTVSGPDFEIKDLAPGSYYLSITDAEGCVVTSNTVTLVYGPTILEADDLIICEGEDAVFVPNALPLASGATFKWFKDSNLTQPISTTSIPDSKGHTFQISTNGTLTVSNLDNSDSPISFYFTISGGNSCPGFKKEVKATVNRLPVLNYTPNDEVCFGAKGTIILEGSAADGIFEYSLDGTTFQTSNSFQVAPGTYTGYVRSGAGCVVSVPNIVIKGSASPLDVTTPVKNDSNCNSTDGSMSFDIAGGYENYSVEITRNGQIYSTDVVGVGTYTIANLPSGNYVIRVVDTGGCMVQVPSQIQIEDLPTQLSATGDVICVGEIVSLVPSTTQVGINPVYTWYQNSDGTGQINSGTSGGINYQIGTNGTLTIDGLAGRSTPYTFYVKISGAGVCEPPLLPVEVKVYEYPNLRVSNPSIVCDPNGSVDLTQHIEGFNPEVYDYMIYNSSGSLMRLEDVDEVVVSGEYEVNSAYKGSNCWSSQKRIQVLISDELLVADFEYEADLGGGNFVRNSEAQILEEINFADFTLGNVVIWNWDFGDGTSSSDQNPTHIYQKKGAYTVSLTTIDRIGCVSETQQFITVLDDYVIIIPNAFTPDGVKNLYFKPQFRGVAKMEFYIFNTWGELVFHSSGLETLGWDGTLNGQKVPNGNYVYRATFETRSGEQLEKSGVFLLIR